MSNIGNISGPQGQIPQKRIDTLDTQKKPADKPDSKAAQASQAQQAGDTADVQRDGTLLAKAREAFEKSQAVREDRIAEVTERLKSGFYDRPEVIEALASGLARGLRA
jgi:hypothetical protein